MSTHRVPRLAAIAACFALACAGEPSPEPPSNAPRLVLLMVVDQLGGEHLTRFDEVLEGGLRRLLDEGLSFREAHHAHADTTTAPGHATVASGCHPSQHGIISNYWIDPLTGETVYAVDDEQHERAPTRLECTTLGDWLKDRYPASRVFALSAKDRSAILLAGRRADGAYWYDWDGAGAFTSSSYYPEASPRWLAELNARGALADRFGEIWSPLSVEPEALARMAIVDYDLGPLQEDSPHPVGGASLAPGNSFFGDVAASPWMDEHLLRLARGLIEAEGLGADRFPDVLALGFSPLDAVGHGYGPDSREFLDVVMRLDRELASFFEWLDRTVGIDKVAIALTSDHGSVPVPEMRIDAGLPGARVGLPEISCLQGIDAELDRELGPRQWFLPGPFFAPVSPEAGVSASELRQRVRSRLEGCPSVSKVWLAEDLAGEGDGGDDAMRRRFANSFFAGRSPDLMIQWDEYYLPSSRNASSHGTAHRYDTHVPLIVRLPGAQPGVSDAPVRTVDLAPTLAAALGVTPPASIGGRGLAGLVPASASSEGP